MSTPPERYTLYLRRGEKAEIAAIRSELWPATPLSQVMIHAYRLLAAAERQKRAQKEQPTP